MSKLIITVIGADDHPLGKRIFRFHPDGSATMTSEAYGLVDTCTYGADEAEAVIGGVLKAYVDHDTTRGLPVTPRINVYEEAPDG